MRSERRLTVAVLLAGLLAGCAQPLTLAELNLTDSYYASEPDAAPLQPATLARCWNWLDDERLGELEDGEGLTPATKAEIATRYSLMRARQTQIENARTYLAAQQDNLEIARFREQAGLVTTRDAVQADAERARVAATIPALEAGIAADASRIAVLGGQAPVALRDRLVLPGPIPTEPAEIAVGTPSDLLTRRPDLVEAAKRMQTAWLKAASPQEEYRTAVLAALEDVEDARSTFAGSVARALSLSTAEQKAAELARLTRAQYRDGQADYAALSGAETALLDTRNALATARAERAGAAIGLCVALGGGASLPAVKSAAK